MVPVELATPVEGLGHRRSPAELTTVVASPRPAERRAASGRVGFRDLRGVARTHVGPSRHGLAGRRSVEARGYGASKPKSIGPVGSLAQTLGKLKAPARAARPSAADVRLHSTIHTIFTAKAGNALAFQALLQARK